MAGKYIFGSGVAAKGGGSAVTNEVNITATRILTANADLNIGTNADKMLLGAGSQLTLDLGGPVQLQVTQGIIDTLIQNGGCIKADGGVVCLTNMAAGALTTSIINTIGTIKARNLVANEQSRIVLSSGHAVIQPGTLDASGFRGAAGGHIAINITNLIEAGQTYASGQAPGGQIDVNTGDQVPQTTAVMMQADFRAGKVLAGEAAWLPGRLSAAGKLDDRSLRVWLVAGY